MGRLAALFHPNGSSTDFSTLLYKIVVLCHDLSGKLCSSNMEGAFDSESQEIL
jgi:hypothetical protein